jgi:hypothetical protein
MTKSQYFFCFILLILGSSVKAQVATKASTLEPEPWKETQLLQPSVLAAKLKANSPHGIILNIGFVEDIKDAKHIGSVNQADNLEKLKKTVASLPKNTELIIYCGCCPLHTKCPNARPAYRELTKLGFTNIKVLDLVTNLKTDWVNQGYSLAAK